MPSPRKFVGIPQFFDRRDTLLAISAEIVIFGGTSACYLILHHFWVPDIFGTLFFLWIVSMMISIIVLKAIRTIVPIVPGTYRYDCRCRVSYAWTLCSFIYSINLGVIYNDPSIVPSPLKKLFYRMLGAKFGRGPIMLGGKLTDPYLITVEEGAIIGGETWLLPHALATFDTKVLILGTVVVRRDAIVGASTLIMPDTEVGAGAMIRAMSYVPPRSRIPPGETWGGNPAVLLRGATPEVTAVASSGHNACTD